MNRTQALAKLRPILGKSIAWREDDRAPTGEARISAQEAYAAAQAAHMAAKAAREERYKAILEGDAEYQRLRAEATKAHEARDKAGSLSRHRRITVGTRSDVGGLGFFHVRAEGDNWQEVVDILTKKKAAA